MKKTVYVLMVPMAIVLTGFAGIHYLGLDDDVINGFEPSFDDALEKRGKGETRGGHLAVAGVIAGAVKSQFQKRADRENIEDHQKREGKYSYIYKDLPEGKAYATRDVHRKTHGCYSASLNVSDSLFTDFNNVTRALITERRSNPRAETSKGPMPQLLENESELGTFLPGKTYDALVRFSNGHPKNRHDNAPDARGFAVKILDPSLIDESAGLDNHDAGAININTELDILSINFPTFFVDTENTAQKYRKINEIFFKGAQDFDADGLVAKGIEFTAIVASGTSRKEALLALVTNGSVIESPLYQNYFSMVPSRLGPKGKSRAVKYLWKPESCPGDEGPLDPEIEQLANSMEDFDSSPWWTKHHYAVEALDHKKVLEEQGLDKADHYYLRDRLQARLAKKDFCYGLYFQPYRDEVSTNIEDSTDIWFGSDGQKKYWLDHVLGGSDEDGGLRRLVKGGFVHRTAFRSERKRAAVKAVVPPVRAATLRIGKITPSKGELAQNTKFCEDLSFNPWNGNITSHKPLGVISRLKRRVYNASRRTRHLINDIKESAEPISEILQKIDRMISQMNSGKEYDSNQAPFERF